LVLFVLAGLAALAVQFLFLIFSAPSRLGG
jgi:hypothetical protein